MQDSPGYTAQAAPSRDAAACELCGSSGSIRGGSLQRYLAVTGGGAVERRVACRSCAASAEAQGWIRESPRLGEWTADHEPPRTPEAPPSGGNGAGSAIAERARAEPVDPAACAICGRGERALRPHLAVVGGGVERREVCDSCGDRAKARGWVPQAPQLAAHAAELDVLTPLLRPEPAAPAPAVRPRLRRRALAVALRTLSAVLVTTGVLGLLDVVITLTWQEPITAISASIEQGKLSDEVETLEQEARVNLASIPDQKPVGEVAAEMREKLDEGDAIGRLSIERIGIDFALVEDAGSDASLRRGPARYTSTYLPGEGRTMGVAGHRTTYDAPFNDIDALEKGDEIVVDMPYGDFTYAVQESEIVLPEEVDVLDNGRREKLVMTACHPLYSAAERIVVTAVLEDAESDRPGVAV